MLSDTLEEVGIPRGDYLVRVNNRKVLNGFLLMIMNVQSFPLYVLILKAQRSWYCLTLRQCQDWEKG